MKKALLISLSLLVLFAPAAIASDKTINDGKAAFSTQTADAEIFDGRAYFKGFAIMPDGTNAVTITFYDNTAGSGSKILPTMTFAGDGGAQSLPIPVRLLCKNGIYADITTSGTVEYTVFYHSR